MATQPPPAAPGNGGNHVGLKVGDKTISVTSQNLVLLVFIIAVGFLSWERGKATTSHLARLDASQANLVEAIHTGDTTVGNLLQAEFHTLRESLLSRQLDIQKASSEERAALSQALATHTQASQVQQSQIQACLDQLSTLRQRLPGP